MSPVQQRWSGGLVLALAAVGIWAKDQHWTIAIADTLPLALGIPLAYFLGLPWRLELKPLSPRQKLILVASAILFLVAWVLSNITLLAVAWSGLTMVWAAWTFSPQAHRARLGWLLLLAFPWLFLEWQWVGYVFRLSSAVVAEILFNFLEMTTHRDATNLNVLGVPIEIEASCAGWNLLQLTLLAGVAFGAYEIPSPRRFALLISLLPAVAWIANLFRIMILSGVALSFDVELASGTLHGLTGLAVLALVLAITKLVCFLLVPQAKVLSQFVKTP